MPLTDPRVLALVCDACHRGLPGITAQPDAWPVLWRIAVDRGWSGPADPGGPHRCPTCGHPIPHHPAASPPARLLAHLAAVGAAAVVRLTGDLDASVTEDLHAVLNHAMADRTHLVLDLHGVHLVDSTALGVLVRAQPATQTPSWQGLPRGTVTVSSGSCCTRCTWRRCSRRSRPLVPPSTGSPVRLYCRSTIIAYSK